MSFFERYVEDTLTRKSPRWSFRGKRKQPRSEKPGSTKRQSDGRRPPTDVTTSGRRRQATQGMMTSQHIRRSRSNRGLLMHMTVCVEISC